MELFQVRYENFKLEAAAKKLKLFHAAGPDGMVVAYAMADPYGLSVRLSPGADLDDFTANWMPRSREVQDEQEAIGLSKSPQLSVQSHGVYTGVRQYIALGNAPDLYTAQPNTVNIWDTEITSGMVGADSKMELFGGEYWTDALVESGDYVEFAVVDKDDVLGLFAGLGLDVVDNDVLELAKYVQKRGIGKSEYGQIRPGQSAELIAGLYLRTIYVATNAGAARTLRVSYDVAR